MSLDVTGRDRVRFFNRPNISNSATAAPLPYIRYAIDAAGPGEIFEVEERRRQQKQQQHQKRSGSARAKTAATATVDSFTQTATRDSEAQTDPCSLDIGVSAADNSELLSLRKLKYRRGLPVKTAADLEMVKRLRWAWQDPEVEGPDPYEIDLTLREGAMEAARTRRMNQTRKALEEFSISSERASKQRLDLLSWRMDVRDRESLRRTRHYWKREIRAMQQKCVERNERMAASGGGRVRMRDRLRRILPQAVLREKSRVGVLFEEEMEVLVSCESKLSRKMIQFGQPAADDDAAALGRGAKDGAKTTSLSRRSQRHGHLLDSVYNEIQIGKAGQGDRRGPTRASGRRLGNTQHLVENFRRSGDSPLPKVTGNISIRCTGPIGSAKEKLTPNEVSPVVLIIFDQSTTVASDASDQFDQALETLVERTIQRAVSYVENAKT